jgi:hypothetical protein
LGLGALLSALAGVALVGAGNVRGRGGGRRLVRVRVRVGVRGRVMVRDLVAHLVRGRVWVRGRGQGEGGQVVVVVRVRVRVRCALRGLLGLLGELGLGRGGGTEARWGGVGRLAEHGVHHGCCAGARDKVCVPRGAPATVWVHPEPSLGLTQSLAPCGEDGECVRGYAVAMRHGAGWGRLRRRRVRRCARHTPQLPSLGRCVPNMGSGVA